MSETEDKRNERWRNNVMNEYNPDEWNPGEDAERHYEAGTVNIWDPVEGEGYDEPGHWAARDPDMDAEHARRLALRGEFDGEDKLPLISSDMRGVPTEGVQGSYTVVTRLDEPCPECEHEYGTLSVVTMAGVHRLVCLTCDHVVSEG